MPLKNGHLTPREKAFAAHYARTGDTAYAAEKAGFRSMSGGTNALARPGVRGEVDRLFMQELQSEILPLALKRHKQILADPRSNGPALTKAIELAYKHGFAERPGTGPDKELHDMSVGELARVLLAASIDPTVTDLGSADDADEDPIFG